MRAHCTCDVGLPITHNHLTLYTSTNNYSMRLLVIGQTRSDNPRAISLKTNLSAGICFYSYRCNIADPESSYPYGSMLFASFRDGTVHISYLYIGQGPVTRISVVSFSPAYEYLPFLYVFLVCLSVFSVCLPACLSVCLHV